MSSVLSTRENCATWYFNPFAWQLLFVFAAWCGVGAVRVIRPLVQSRAAFSVARGSDHHTRVNFALTPPLEPRLRTLGTGLPGYRAGWFRLRNGEKALLYLTDESRAVYVPTTAGYSVIVSPQDPDAFLAALKGR